MGEGGGLTEALYKTIYLFLYLGERVCTHNDCIYLGVMLLAGCPYVRETRPVVGNKLI